MLTTGGGSVAPSKIQDNSKENKVVLNSASDQIEFTTNNTLQGTLNADGSLVLGTGSGALGLEVVRSTASLDYGLKLRNNANGDIKLTMETAAQSFSFGIDNSDNDYLKLSTSSIDVGTNSVWIIKNDGSLGIGIEPTTLLDINGVINVNNNVISSVATPVAGTDAANKSYIDTALAGQNLGDHNDVVLTSPATGALIKFDGANWIDSPVTIDTNNTIIAVNGTAADPSLAFVGGTNTGIYYRTGPSALIVCQAGNDVAEFSSSQITLNRDVEFGFLGSAAAPNLSLGSDNTTGIAFPGSGQVLFTSGGTLVARILSSSLDLNSNKITDVADPTLAQDAMTLNYADTNYQPLDAGLTSISGLSTAADTMIYTTAADTYATSSLTSLARDLLADSTQSEMRDTLQLNAGQAGDIWVEKAGDTMTGSLVLNADPSLAFHAATKQYVDNADALKLDLAGGTLTGFLTLSADPTNALHAATKQYVDALAAGLDPKESVVAATTANLSGYSPTGGSSSSGGFTNIDTTTFDGHTMAVSDRVLVLNQTDAKQNGIYIITSLNASTGAMERAVDHDGTPSNEVSGGNTTFVENGTTYSGRTYALQGDGNLALNTDNLTWQLLSNASDWAWGTGLTNTGNTVNLTANLNDLQDVNTSPSGGNPLYYDGGSGEWQANSGILFTGAGIIRATSGGAGSPTYSFSSDTSLGLYRIGADSLGVSVGGTLTARFDTAGFRVDSGTAKVPDGSAASPSYTFTDDQNLGFFRPASDSLAISTAGAERIRIDASGNLLVGKTANAFGTVGTTIRQDGVNQSTVSGNSPLQANRLSNDGNVAQFYRDSALIGSISSVGSATLAIDGASGFTGLQFGSDAILPRDNGSLVNGNIDLGAIGNQFRDGFFNGKVQISNNVALEADSLTTTATTQVAIYEFAAATYSGAKLLVTVHDTVATERHIVEILVTHDGVTAVGTEYGKVVTNADLATFDIDISGGNVRLLATPASANSTNFKTVSTQLL